MLGFPVPYTNELIYSTVARAGTHFGIESPKELLEEVFGNRKVIATLDLPCHLQKIAGLYPETLNLGVENLVNKHTLFPIYAPFVNEDRRLQCLNWMAGVSQGGRFIWRLALLRQEFSKTNASGIVQNVWRINNLVMENISGVGSGRYSVLTVA
jgi:hypothetical protein